MKGTGNKTDKSLTN